MYRVHMHLFNALNAAIELSSKLGDDTQVDFFKKRLDDAVNTYRESLQVYDDKRLETPLSEDFTGWILAHPYMYLYKDGDVIDRIDIEVDYKYYADSVVSGHRYGAMEYLEQKHSIDTEKNWYTRKKDGTYARFY